MGWYISQRGMTSGPFTEQQIVAALGAGAEAGTMVCPEGTQTWMPIGNVPTFGAMMAHQSAAVTMAAAAKLDPKVRVCPVCAYVGVPARVTRGGVGLELLLWCLACLPGLIYSVWRLTSKVSACASCGGRVLLMPGSPLVTMNPALQMAVVRTVAGGRR